MSNKMFPPEQSHVPKSEMTGSFMAYLNLKFTRRFKTGLVRVEDRMIHMML